MLGTFEKARAVLDLYTTDHPEWGVTEVARTLGMPPSSTHLLMSSLTQMGLLHRTVAGRYRLGFKLLALSQVLMFNTPWREVAEEEMAALFKQFGETLSLAAFDGGQIVTVAVLAGQQPGSVQVPRVGAVLPVYRSASGRMLLAHRPWPVVQGVLNNPRTSGLDDDVQSAAQILAAVLQDDLATFDDLDRQVWSVAAPVRNHNGEAISTVAFTVPGASSQERREILCSAVQQACQRISERIGYSETSPQERRLLWLSVDGQDRLQSRPARGRGPAR